MAIQDPAGNLFITQSSSMIGFVQVDLVADRPLQLRIYEFLLHPLRQMDQDEGNQFVERLLTGAQEVWNGIDLTIRSLPKMWSVTDCRDAFLPYLKWIVGWTSELDSITNELDSLALRRLIASSVPFWKIRGTEDAIVDILRLVTGVRLRVWNWFDLRWICDETTIGEAHHGYDPWMLDLPGAPENAEYGMNVRIVDNGTLNHELVRNVIKLSRPSSERITVSYIGFLDLFALDDDDSQWGHNGSGTAVVVDGSMILTNGADAVTIVDGAVDWLNLTFTARVRGDGQIQFFRTASTDFYFLRIDNATDEVSLGYLLAGVETIITTVNTGFVLDYDLKPDVFHSFRVEATTEPPGTFLAVYIDGNSLMSVNDSTHVQGAIGFAAELGATFEIDDVEMFFNPLASDLIDINS